MEYLCVRSVERKSSSIGKIYFQLRVSEAYFWGPPKELIDCYNSDSWIEARDERFVMNVFDSDENKQVLKWCFSDYEEGLFDDVTAGFNIGEMINPYKSLPAYFYNKSINLYDDCNTNIIKPGCILCGIIAKSDVMPYEFDGKLVSSYTRPILWQEELSDEQKQDYIKSIFAKNGKIVIEKQSGNENNIERGLSQIEESGDYDKYNGPSDGYGGYLDDDFIDDVLGGDEDAYWNLD